jgi:hypothetical protein
MYPVDDPWPNATRPVVGATTQSPSHLPFGPEEHNAMSTAWRWKYRVPPTTVDSYVVR